MIAAIDAGNSRIKWGLHDGSGWAAAGVLATADARWLAEAAEEWPPGTRVVVCNVAGAAVGAAIADALRPLTLPPLSLHLLPFHSAAACCGVSNGYANPAQLGADRWAALLGARALTASACLVVCAGTATTIDTLTADGHFSGGVILPGFDLMRGALAGNTAQLPFADGECRGLPANTADAIVSGCLAAQLGAIERRFAAIAGDADAVCIVTGGAMPRLLPHLTIPVRHEERLILAGLVRYASSFNARPEED